MLTHKQHGTLVPVAQNGENVAVNLKHGESLQIAPANKCKKPPFLGIYGGAYIKGNEKNLLQQIGDMNTAERRFFLLVEEHMNYETNTAYIDNTLLSPSQKAAKTKGFKALRKKNIIKRVKREHYMINPDIIIPLGKKANGNELYPDLKESWEALP